MNFHQRCEIGFEKTLEDAFTGLEAAIVLIAFIVVAAVFITLSVPIAGSLNLLFLYMPAVIILGIAGVLCFLEPVEIAEEEPE